MEIDFGSFVEDGLRQGRGSFGSGGVGSPEDDVELRLARWGEELGAFGEAAVEFMCCGMAVLKPLGEYAAKGIGEKLLGRPESYGGGPGAGALQGDLAEVKLF